MYIPILKYEDEDTIFYIEEVKTTLCSIQYNEYIDVHILKKRSKTLWSIVSIHNVLLCMI